jgi:demethylmenaquinone methyltransferase/2-methoxy-6-polyprenyl-1,4-benzoquinol methylase
LDVGTGTGDLSAALVDHGAELVVGADVEPRMLRAAARKRHAGAHEWCVVDARHLPFRDASFDAVTNAFLLRNLPDLAGSLREMVRVLRPEGLLVCLDMTPPPRTASGMAFQLYFRRLMPPIAGVLSGDREAYRYLPDSLEGFPDANALAGLLRGAGLADVTCDRLAAGGVALHVARKPA